MKRRRQCWRIHRYANPRVMLDLAQFAGLVEGVSKVMAYTKLVMVLFLSAAVTCEAQTVPLPQIRQNGAVKQFFVDDKPFIMLAGELHNSSPSSIEYMRPIWDKLSALHLNTVIGAASWELVEPKEGNFDFSRVDDQINQARQRNMRLVLIWFATWKNAGSSYSPDWVKADPKRFPPMILKVRPDAGIGSFLAKYMEEQGTGPLSPFGSDTVKADARAFAALMSHITDVDPQHTVIMMQVENEIGSLGDSRDRSPIAEAAWAGPVPADLMNYLTKHKDTLLPEIQEVWGKNGYKTKGNWQQVFGENEWADEVFMAYYMGRYVNEVAKEGKAQLNIPMYVNAWLGPQPKAELPGQWPSGGPVARVMDIYRAAAPSIDLFAPDIYVPDFKGTCALYARSGNPLFIPEARDQVGNLFWALGHHSALGWSPFGIEDLSPDGQVAQTYKLLSPMLPQLAEWQAAGKVNGILVIDGEKSEPVSLGGLWHLAQRLPRQIPGRSSGQALLQHPVQCPVTCAPSQLWSTPRPTNSSSSVRMGIPPSRLIQARERPLSPQRTKGAMRTDSGLPAAESTAMKCLNPAYPKLKSGC